MDPDPGHGYTSLSYSNYQASQYLAGLYTGYSPNPQFNFPVKYGTKQPISIPFTPAGTSFGASLNSRYTNNSAQFYGEVSLGGHFGVVATMPLVQSISQNESKGANLSTVHPGDLVVGLKYQVPVPKIAGLAFGPQVYITSPTGDVSAKGQYSTPGLRAVNDPLPLPTGNGTFDIETRLSAGYSFYPIPVFIIGDVGYHHHWDNATCTGLPDPDKTGITKQSVTFSDDIPWDLQFGGTYQPKKLPKWFHHITVIGILHGTKSLENGYIDKSGNAPYLRPCGQSNNMTFFSAGGQIMLFPIKWVGITYSVEHVINGGNVGYGLTNTVGLAAQF